MSRDPIYIFSPQISWNG